MSMYSSIQGNSTPQNGATYIPANQVMVIQKGAIFSELERLKGLDNHRHKLEQI